MYILVGVEVYFSSKKGEFDRFFDRLDRPVEESRLHRFLTVKQLSTLLHCYITEEKSTFLFCSN